MKLNKRIAAAVLSGCLAVSAVQSSVALTGFAAVTDYDSNDYVWFYDESLFRGTGETAPNEKFIKAIQSATNVKDYTEITFGDLERVTVLNLSGLGLESIPGVIQYMPRLRTLDLSNNKLRSATIGTLDLSKDIALTSVDLSNNYLTSVPAWFSALNITTKKINNNLLNTTNQRKLIVTPDTYYFGVGDTISEQDIKIFKDKVLSTVTLSDKSMLPEYFYDPDLPTYNIPDSEKNNTSTYLRNENIEFDIDFSSYLTNGVVSKAGKITGTIALGIYGNGTSSNPNIRATVTVYFLDGNDPTTVKFRLETLIAECEKLTKESYTSNSWTVFSNQLSTAKAILSYSNTDSTMLQNAYDSLTEAKKNLVSGVNTNTKKILTDLLTIAKTYKEEDYTAESWKPLDAAITMLTDASNDTSTSLDDANKTIKAFQDAQNGLVPTKQSVPDKITKAQFESIYGENKTVTAKGATRDGSKYSWKFTGTDVSKPADFDPEVLYTSSNEEQIRFEVGSASDYQIISFKQTGAFPGIGELTLDVSNVYKNGTYRLYKWNATTKKSEFIREVTVENGSVTTSFSEGGDYFISSVLQNFQMISSNFKINNDKRTIAAGFKKKYTVADFRENIENGEAIKVTNADGTAATETQYIATGMKAMAPNSDVSYSLIVSGDVDGDGNCTALDAVNILKAVIGETTLDTYEQKAAADVNDDGWVRADDAVVILKYIVGMD